MKKILSLLVTLALLLTSVGSLAAGSDTAFTLEYQMRVNADELAAVLQKTGALKEESSPQLNLVADVLNATSARIVIDKGVIQGELLAEDEAFLTLGAQKNETGVRIASSLLGDQVLFISPEMLKKLSEMSLEQQKNVTGIDFKAVAEAFQKLDYQQVGTDIAGYVQTIFSTIMSKAGAPEQGEFTVNGVAFTTKTPINITFDELAELVLGCAKDFFSKDYVRNITGLIWKDKNLPAGFANAIKKVKELPEDQKFAVTFEIYSNEGGDSGVVFELHRGGQESSTPEPESICTHVTVQGKNVNVIYTFKQKDTDIKMDCVADTAANTLEFHMNANDGKQNIVYTVTAENGRSEAIVEMTGGQIDMKGHTVATKETDAFTIVSESFFGGSETATTVSTLKITKGGEITMKFTGDDVKDLPLESLLKDQNALAPLAMTAYGNVLQAFNTLIKHLPEESANLANQLVSQLIQQSNPIK